MYETGFRINEYDKAWVWYCPAAHKGHAKAQYTLANYYRLGHSPVQRNIIKSYVWLTLSLKGGGPHAGARDRTEREMTPDQIAEGESLVAKWKPNPAECEGEAKLAAD